MSKADENQVNEGSDGEESFDPDPFDWLYEPGDMGKPAEDPQPKRRRRMFDSIAATRERTSESVAAVVVGCCPLGCAGDTETTGDVEPRSVEVGGEFGTVGALASRASSSHDETAFHPSQSFDVCSDAGAIVPITGGEFGRCLANLSGGTIFLEPDRSIALGRNGVFR